MNATIGRIVILKLSEGQCGQINAGRDKAALVSMRIGAGDPALYGQHLHAHAGNPVSAGQEVPMIIVRTWSDSYVNGQALLDGTDSFWASSVHEGSENGEWHWPVIKAEAVPLAAEPEQTISKPKRAGYSKQPTVVKPALEPEEQNGEGTDEQASDAAAGTSDPAPID